MGNKPIVHAPVATGSTEPRDIRDRFADFVNLKDFGAVGNGITDDSTAWAAWRTALQNGGMPYIPKGDYLLGEEILHAPKGHIGGNTNSFSYEDDGTVINEFNAAVYVDVTNGNDANDGMTATTAIKTINKGIAVLESLPSVNGVSLLYIKGGTYTEYVEFLDKQVFVHLNGSVTINGRLRISNSVVHFIQDTTGNLNIATDSSGYDKINISNTSNAVFELPVNISGACNKAVHVNTLSYCRFAENVSINTSGEGVITSLSYCIFNNSLSINISGNARGIGCYDASLVNIEGNLTVSTQGDGVVADNAGSMLIKGQTVNISYGYAAFMARNCALLQIVDFSTVTLTRTANNGVCCRCIDLGHIYMESSVASSAINIIMGSFSGGYCFQNWSSGYTSILATTLSFSGNTYENCILDTNSFFSLPSSVTVTGSLTGRRYNVRSGSVLTTQGSGVYRLPGSINGNVETYGIYM